MKTKILSPQAGEEETVGVGVLITRQIASVVAELLSMPLPIAGCLETTNSLTSIQILIFFTLTFSERFCLRSRR